MPWRELTLVATDDLEELTLFTTAELRWQPVVSDEPQGAQMATLWGDPAVGPFGAVVRSPNDPPDVYKLIRSTD